MLSSVISILLSPFNWIIILLLFAWIFRKRRIKKVLLIGAACVFVIFGNSWLLNLAAKNYQPARISMDSIPVYSCGIVAGGFAGVDNDAHGYFNSSADRFIQAVKLYKTGRVNHLLISGGNAKTTNPDFHEAAFVKKELIQFGVPDSVIFIEDLSNNTADNAVNSKHILDSVHLQPPFLLITSAFHMPRALATFRDAGLAVDGFPAHFTDGMDSFSFDDLLPRVSVLLTWDNVFKEFLGYVYYRNKGKK